MAKYLMLKHYRGGPDRDGLPQEMMDRWTPEEVSAHLAFMDHVADVLRERGEYVDGQALRPEGTFVRYDGEGRPPVTDGPFAETKDLIAGWMVVDVDSEARAYEAAALLSSAPSSVGAATSRRPRTPCRRRCSRRCDAGPTAPPTTPWPGW